MGQLYKERGAKFGPVCHIRSMEMNADPRGTFDDQIFLHQFEDDLMKTKLSEVNWSLLKL